LLQWFVRETFRSSFLKPGFVSSATRRRPPLVGVLTLQRRDPGGQQAARDGQDVIIENEPVLPDTYPLANYEVRFRAQGGVLGYAGSWKRAHCRPE